MSVILKQFDGGAIAPRDDAILYNSIITRNGILNGCTITHLGANQIKITAGRGIIKGRMFEVEEMTVNCQLASAGTQKGRMYLRMELSNMENPAQIKTVAADTLPELVQEEDCNYTNGIYELELCTYDVTDTLLSNLKTTYEVIDTVFPVAKTLDDVNGVTDEDVLAGALAVKELSSETDRIRVYVGNDGKLHFVNKAGADSVLPFNSFKFLAAVPYNTSRVSGSSIPFDLSAYSGEVIIAFAFIWAYGVSLDTTQITFSPEPEEYLYKAPDAYTTGESWGYNVPFVIRINVDKISNKTLNVNHKSNGQMRGCQYFIFQI